MSNFNFNKFITLFSQLLQSNIEPDSNLSCLEYFHKTEETLKTLDDILVEMFINTPIDKYSLLKLNITKKIRSVMTVLDKEKSIIPDDNFLKEIDIINTLKNYTERRKYSLLQPYIIHFETPAYFIYNSNIADKNAVKINKYLNREIIKYFFEKIQEIVSEYSKEADNCKKQDSSKKESNKEMHLTPSICSNSEVMAHFDISKSTLLRWRKRGTINYTKIDGKIYYPITELDRLTRNKKTA